MQILQNTPGHVAVALSERNLRRLAELYAERGRAGQYRLTESGVVLTVLVESDARHYTARPDAQALYGLDEGAPTQVADPETGDALATARSAVGPTPPCGACATASSAASPEPWGETMPVADACCANEARAMDGGCGGCGAPCL